MSDVALYRLLADALLVIHFAFVVFVVVGFLLILLGLLARWTWVHNRKFRITHLAAIGIVVLQAWFGQLCPLTICENALRHVLVLPLESFLHSVVSLWDYSLSPRSVLLMLLAEILWFFPQ